MKNFQVFQYQIIILLNVTYYQNNIKKEKTFLALK